MARKSGSLRFLPVMTSKAAGAFLSFVLANVKVYAGQHMTHLLIVQGARAEPGCQFRDDLRELTHLTESNISSGGELDGTRSKPCRRHRDHLIEIELEATTHELLYPRCRSRPLAWTVTTLNQASNRCRSNVPTYRDIKFADLDAIIVVLALIPFDGETAREEEALNGSYELFEFFPVTARTRHIRYDCTTVL
jgi:hypothetical protein